MCKLEDLCEDCAFKSKCKKYKENKLLKNKLETAVKALRIYANLRYDGTVTGYETIAKEALKEIKE